MNCFVGLRSQMPLRFIPRNCRSIRCRPSRKRDPRQLGGNTMYCMAYLTTMFVSRT